MRPETVEKIAAIFDRAKQEALAVLRHEAPAQTPATLNDEGVTVREAAKMIGVSEWRIYQMIKQGILPAFRPSPRTLRLSRAAVLEFIRTGKAATAKVTPFQRSSVLHSAASNLRKEA